MKTFTDQIRDAVLKCGMSRYAVSRQTDIDQAALSRFVHGKAGLSLASIDRLAKLLNLQIATDKPKSKRSK